MRSAKAIWAQSVSPEYSYLERSAGTKLRKPNPEQSIRSTDLDPTSLRSAQDVQLMAQSKVLQMQGCSSLK